VQAAAALDALYKKSNWLEGVRDKNHQADAARDNGAKRALVSSSKVICIKNGDF
jgi:hypothetical protein